MKKIYKITIPIVVILIVAGLLGIFFLPKFNKQEPAPDSPKKITKPPVPEQDRAPESPKEVTKLPVSVEDYVQRFSAAIKLPDAQEKGQALRDLGIGLSDEDFGKVEDILKSWYNVKDLQPIWDKENITRASHAQIFSRWVEVNPVAAVNWANRLLSFPPGETLETFGFSPGNPENPVEVRGNFNSNGLMGKGTQQKLLKNLVTQWSWKDAQASLAWAQNLPEGDLRTETLNNVKIVMACTHPNPEILLPEIFKDYGQWTPDDSKDEWVRCAAQNTAIKWTRKDGPAVAAWIQGMPVSRLLRQVLPFFMEEWMKSDSKSCREWVEKLPDIPDSHKTIAIYYVVSKGIGNFFNAKKFDEVRQWVEQLPEGASKKVAVNCMLRQWVHGDLPAARKWAEQLPGDKAERRFEAVVSIMSHTSCRTNPQRAEAMTWLSRQPEFSRILEDIQAKDGRVKLDTGMVKWIVKEWVETDLQAATAWAQALPESKDREKMLNIIKLLGSK